MSIDPLVMAFAYVFGPLLPYFFGAIIAGGVITAFLTFGIDVGRLTGRD